MFWNKRKRYYGGRIVTLPPLYVRNHDKDPKDPGIRIPGSWSCWRRLHHHSSLLGPPVREVVLVRVHEDDNGDEFRRSDEVCVVGAHGGRTKTSGWIEGSGTEHVLPVGVVRGIQ